MTGRRLLFQAFGLGAFLLLVFGAGQLTESYSEREIEDAVHRHAQGLGSADVEISSFPFLVRMAAFGEVDRLTTVATRVERSGLVLDRVTVIADGLGLDRSDLIAGDVTLTHVDRLTVKIRVLDRDLDAVLPVGVTVRLEPGQAYVVVGGTEIPVVVAIEDGELVLGGPGGQSFTVRWQVDDLLACPPTIEIGVDELRISCTGDELPPFLVESAGRVI